MTAYFDEPFGARRAIRDGRAFNKAGLTGRLGRRKGYCVRRRYRRNCDLELEPVLFVLWMI